PAGGQYTGRVGGDQVEGEFTGRQQPGATAREDLVPRLVGPPVGDWREKNLAPLGLPGDRVDVLPGHGPGSGQNHGHLPSSFSHGIRAMHTRSGRVGHAGGG
ncbi:hypothetical protein EG861_14770, partial [Enterococcus faecalis]